MARIKLALIMRYILVLILFFTNPTLGQTKKFLVSDTSVIGFKLHQEETPTDSLPIITYDTLFYFSYDLLKAGGHFIGYYDKAFRHKALEIITDKKGKQIGYRDYWYRNGQIKEHIKDTIFVKDFVFYDATQWYPDGKIKHNNIFNGKDSTISTYYYPNGNLKMKEKEYYDTTLSHQLYCYNERRFPNGQLCNTPLIDNWLTKRQKVIYYFENGTTKISSTMFFVENIGKYEEWNKDSVLIISGQYEDYPTIETEIMHRFRKINKVGNWKYYNNRGELTREEIYGEKGKLISIQDK